MNLTKLDGGTGSDTLSFGNMGSQGSTELTLTGGGASNFENIDGTGGADIIEAILELIYLEALVVQILFMVVMETTL